MKQHATLPVQKICFVLFFIQKVCSPHRLKQRAERPFPPRYPDFCILQVGERCLIASQQMPYRDAIVGTSSPDKAPIGSRLGIDGHKNTSLLRINKITDVTTHYPTVDYANCQFFAYSSQKFSSWKTTHVSTCCLSHIFTHQRKRRKHRSDLWPHARIGRSQNLP